jgi:hypothetical protein
MERSMKETSKEIFDRDARIHQSPVTKKEMELRIQQRSRPTFTYHLQPDGSTRQEINTQVEAENERRIGFIRHRLERMEGRPTRDFERSR